MFGIIELYRVGRPIIRKVSKIQILKEAERHRGMLSPLRYSR